MQPDPTPETEAWAANDPTPETELDRWLAKHDPSPEQLQRAHDLAALGHSTEEIERSVFPERGGVSEARALRSVADQLWEIGKHENRPDLRRLSSAIHEAVGPLLERVEAAEAELKQSRDGHTFQMVGVFDALREAGSPSIKDLAQERDEAQAAQARAEEEARGLRERLEAACDPAEQLEDLASSASYGHPRDPEGYESLSNDLLDIARRLHEARAALHSQGSEEARGA